MVKKQNKDFSEIENPIVKKSLERRCKSGFIFNYADMHGEHQDWKRGGRDHTETTRNHHDHRGIFYEDYSDHSEQYSEYWDFSE